MLLVDMCIFNLFNLQPKHLTLMAGSATHHKGVRKLPGGVTMQLLQRLLPRPNRLTVIVMIIICTRCLMCVFLWFRVIIETLNIPM